MKTRRILLTALLFCLAQPLAQVQGAFQNLDFESATLVPILGDPYNSVQFAQAFPGWTGIVGGVPQTSALYDNYFLDSSGITIIDSSVPYLNFRPAQGRFAAVLQAGWVLNQPGIVANATLSQTGTIPVLYNSLLFEAAFSGGGPSSLGVTVGGHPLPLVPLQSEGNYELYGVDIRGLAGTSVEVDFTLFAQNPHISNIYAALDAIQFSGLIVPEPGVSALGFLGALLFVARFARGRRHWN